MVLRQLLVPCLVVGLGFSSLNIYAFDLGNLTATITQAVEPQSNPSSPMDKFLGQLGTDRHKTLSAADRLGVSRIVDTAKSTIQTTHNQFIDTLSGGLKMNRNSLSRLLPFSSSPMTESSLLSALRSMIKFPLGGESLNLIQSALGQRNNAISSIKMDLVHKIINMLGGNLNSGMVTALLPMIGL